MTEVTNFEKQYPYTIGEIVRKRFKKIGNRISKKVDMDSFIHIFGGIVIFVLGIFLLGCLIHGFLTGANFSLVGIFFVGLLGISCSVWGFGYIHLNLSLL